MSPIPIMFWMLVLVTALVATRWGAMIGLIGFILALMIGSVAISRWAPPKPDVTAGTLIPAELGPRTLLSGRTSTVSMH